MAMERVSSLRVRRLRRRARALERRPKSVHSGRLSSLAASFSGVALEFAGEDGGGGIFRGGGRFPCRGVGRGRTMWIRWWEFGRRGKR